MTEVIPSSEVTIAEAAVLLNLSEAYILQLLDEGALISLRQKDVLAFKVRSDADRLAALKYLVEEAQELNMGY